MTAGGHVIAGRSSMRWRTTVPALIVAIAALLFASGWWLRQGRDISRFVVAGDVFVDPARAPACLTVHANSGGYDGQFYYRLAISPLSRAPVLEGARFDYPVYRAQRILYPALAFLLSWGDPCRALWALLFINILAVTAIAWVGARYLAGSGLPVWPAVALGLWPGFQFSLARDMTEPLAIALLLAGMTAAISRDSSAPVWLSLAALTRETTLVVPMALVGIGLVNTLRHRRLDGLLLIGAVPVAAFYSWKRFLFWWWDLPVQWGTANVLGWPFAAYASLFRDSLRAGSRAGSVQVIELVVLGVFTLLVLAALRWSRAHVIVRVCCGVYLLFVAGLSREVWIEDWAWLRATAEYGVLGTLAIAFSTPLVRRTGVALVILASLALAYELLTAR